VSSPALERRVGFLVNPIAGMGGRVGLKGTDGIAREAVRLGAEPVAPERARRTLARLASLLARRRSRLHVHWLTCSDGMGETALRRAGFDDVEVIQGSGGVTTAEDTRTAVRRFVERGVELVLFCGGDGTARDVAVEAGGAVAVLGIPSGVKMYSGVFGISPERTAELTVAYLDGSVETAEVEVLDLDEERYRRGEWVVRLQAVVNTPFEPSLVQSSKDLLAAAGDRAVKEEIAEFLRREMDADAGVLWLLGPGSSTAAVGRALGLETSLLGVDAVAGGVLVGRDLDERSILRLCEEYVKRRLVLSPIGAQGFVLGRGNQQLSPAVVRAVGRRGLVVVATPAKLERTPVLHVDTGDPELDRELVGDGHLPVVVGDNRRRMVPLAA